MDKDSLIIQMKNMILEATVNGFSLDEVEKLVMDILDELNTIYLLDAIKTRKAQNLI